MKNLKTALHRLWVEEDAQGATEYILLLVVIVGLAIAFRGQITEMVNAKLNDLGGALQGFTVQGQ
jgi:Flp pilus assembly pilin Flp